MAEAKPGEIECGFCLLTEGLENPKCLPCGHVHCLVCLTRNINIDGLMRCPWCREVFDVNVESLPSANIEDNSISCDICTKKGIKKALAVTYCTFCGKLFCKKHKESHDDTSDHHRQMTISDYRIQAKRLERRVCPKHTEHPISFGCRACIQLFCIQCLSRANTCVGGSTHAMVTLDDLIKELVNMEELINTEDKISCLFKQISKTVSDFDTETTESLDILHRQRDEQLAEVRLKYEKLEEEFLASRQETKEAMDAYMEREVGTVLSELSKGRIKIEAQLKQNNQIDLVEGSAEIKDEIQRLVSIEIPELELCDVMSLEVKGEKRGVEVDVVSAPDISISLDQGVTTSTPPKSLKFLQSTAVSNYCFAVCKYENSAYVGLCGGKIDRIDENCSGTQSFVAVSGDVFGIAEHEGQLYTLVSISHNNWKVNVYDLSGNKVTSWSHSENIQWSNKLAIVGNLVVAADRHSKRLTIYSLAGEVINHVSCSLLSDGDVAVCAADMRCVVVSDSKSSQVFKLDLATEKLIWTSKAVSEPKGVTCYKRKYILVTNWSSKTTIWILDVKTGMRLSKIEDTTVRESSNVLDLHVFRDTLVVPRCNEKKVLLYQLA